jgi:uncharacterized membrane protein YkvA (DUF1232 family)
MTIVRPRPEQIPSLPSPPRPPSHVPWLVALISPIVAVVYLASPLDIIPDGLPVIGYIDDALLLVVGGVLAVVLGVHALITRVSYRSKLRAYRDTLQALPAIVLPTVQRCRMEGQVPVSPMRRNGVCEAEMSQPRREGPYHLRLAVIYMTHGHAAADTVEDTLE